MAIATVDNTLAWQTIMDKEADLLKVLGTLSSRRLEDVADQLIALFRAPEWWEEAFDAWCRSGSMGALQDAATRDTVKACIRALLTRAQHEERQKVLAAIERHRDTVLAGARSPAEHRTAVHLYAALLHDLRHPDGTASDTPARV